MSITNLTPAQLRQAAALKEQIEQLQKQLTQLFGTQAPVSKPVPTVAPKAIKARKKMSAAGIAKIRAAQKARWAKIKSAAPKAVPTPKAPAPAKAPAKKVKRVLSDAARAKMAAAAKARWAKVKGAKAK
jgi:hypothetical protein